MHVRDDCRGCGGGQRRKGLIGVMVDRNLGLRIEGLDRICQILSHNLFRFDDDIEISQLLSIQTLTRERSSMMLQELACINL